MFDMSSILIRHIITMFEEDPLGHIFHYFMRVNSRHVVVLAYNLHCLAIITAVGVRSALKAIYYFDNGMTVCPSSINVGYGYLGMGTIRGLQMQHYTYVYDLYLTKLTKPVGVYIRNIFDYFGILISDMTNLSLV